MRSAGGRPCNLNGLTDAVAWPGFASLTRVGGSSENCRGADWGEAGWIDGVEVEMSLGIRN